MTMLPPSYQTHLQSQLNWVSTTDPTDQPASINQTGETWSLGDPAITDYIWESA